MKFLAKQIKNLFPGERIESTEQQKQWHKLSLARAVELATK